jgi:hypothetical protein
VDTVTLRVDAAGTPFITCQSTGLLAWRPDGATVMIVNSAAGS